MPRRRFESLSPVPQTEPLPRLTAARLRGPTLLLAALLIFGLLAPRAARGQFPQHDITAPTLMEPTSVAAADLDGDGDVDVLSASAGDDMIAWYENRVGESSAGGRSFGPQQVITIEASHAQSVHTADIDGDGDADMLSASSADNTIAWYENQIGEAGADADGFGPQQVITTKAEGAQSVHTADVDGDGDADVLSADGTVAWYENQVGERGADADGFGAQVPIAAGVSVYTADVDGDGDPDVLSASPGRDDTISWYENQIGDPGADSTGFGSSQIITKRALGASSVHAADLDGDGDPDVLSASSDDDTIAWYENKVGQRESDADGFAFQQAITTEAGGAASVHAADIDGDGDPDVLSASTDNDTIAWYENQVGAHGGDGHGGQRIVFGRKQVITTVGSDPQSVFAADLDGDGDSDVLSASRVDNRVAWYENRGGANEADDDGFGPAQAIATSVASTQAVYAADLDGDGDDDVLSASRNDHKIAWYENRSGESGTDADGFGGQKIITTDAEWARAVHAADLDGDGDPDVLSASGSFDSGEVAWYENRIGESGADADGFGARQVIVAGASGASTVHTGDVDGDGDADILSVSAGTYADEQHIAWYENKIGEDATDRFGPQQVITSDRADYRDVRGADLDGDGDADVLAASALGKSKIVWCENQFGTSEADGDGFGGQRVITTAVKDAESVHAADLDGDGDLDVLSASTDDNKIAWYENQMGERGTDADGFGPQQVVSTDAADAASVYASDLDGDGDPDVLATAEDDRKVVWYENRIGESGDDHFGPQRFITIDANDPQSVYSADLDGDSDQDPLSALGYRIAWHENRLGGVEAGAAPKARLAYRKAEAAYEDDRWSDALFYLDRVDTALADNDGSPADTLQSRAGVLRGKALYQDREYGKAKQVLRRVSRRKAVPPVLGEEIALYERRVESALVSAMPPPARKAIRTSASTTELDLSGRELVALPDSIGQLTDLRVLDLSENRLNGVPETVEQLMELQEINLVGNDLTEAEVRQIQDQVPGSTDVAYRRYQVDDRLEYQWHETAQVSLPIEKGQSGGNRRHSQEGVFQSLLDDVIRFLRGRDSLKIRRSQNDSSLVSLAKLQRTLSNKEGIDIRSANHVRIDYEWGITRSQFQREIVSIQFLHRRSGWWRNDTDTPVLYLRTSGTPWFQRLLVEENYLIHHQSHAYIDHLTFPMVQAKEGAELLRIGDRPAAELDEEEKKQLVQKVKRLIYQGEYRY